MNYTERIDQLIKHSNGRVVDVFYELFMYILSLDADMQSSAFQYTCENVKKLEYDDSNEIDIQEHFTDDQLKRFIERSKEKTLKLINDLISESTKHNVSKEKFYETAWNLILSGKTCKSKRDQALMMYHFVDNGLIPYVAIGTGISMSQEQYSDIIDSFDETFLIEAETIINIAYDQKTQRASLLLERINLLNSFHEQSVYLSLILDMVEDRIKEKLKERIDDI